jgi:hypothetical protein
VLKTIVEHEAISTQMLNGIFASRNAIRVANHCNQTLQIGG